MLTFWVFSLSNKLTKKPSELLITKTRKGQIIALGMDKRPVAPFLIIIRPMEFPLFPLPTLISGKNFTVVVSDHHLSPLSLHAMEIIRLGSRPRTNGRRATATAKNLRFPSFFFSKRAIEGRQHHHCMIMEEEEGNDDDDHAKKRSTTYSKQATLSFFFLPPHCSLAALKSAVGAPKRQLIIRPLHPSGQQQTAPPPREQAVRARRGSRSRWKEERILELGHMNSVYCKISPPPSPLSSSSSSRCLHWIRLSMIWKRRSGRRRRECQRRSQTD